MILVSGQLCIQEDLAFSPGGDNPTLGQLCLEIGELEHACVQSWHTFSQDFSYRNDELGLTDSVERLSAWFGEQDGKLQAAIEALTDDDLLSRTIDRGGRFIMPPRIQLEIYKEALLNSMARRASISRRWASRGPGNGRIGLPERHAPTA